MSHGLWLLLLRFFPLIPLLIGAAVLASLFGFSSKR